MSVRPASILLFALALLGCRAGARRATIALSYPAWGRPYAELAESLAVGHRRPPFLVVDTAARRETTAGAVRWAQQVVAMDDVVGVVGPSGSRVALATAPVYNAAGVPQIVPSATSRLLQQVGPWVFPLAPDDSVEGRFIADYLTSALHVRRIILFYTNDEFGQGLRSSLRSALAGARVSVLAESPVSGESDFETLLRASLRPGRPDAIVMAAREDATGAIARLAERLVPGVPIVASDGALRPDGLIAAAGSAIRNIRAVAFWIPDTVDPRVRRFVAAVRATSGLEPDGNVAMIQDAIGLLSTAVAEVGPDRVAVRQWLRSLGRDRPPYAGLTGPISFTGTEAPRMWMARIEHGVVVPVTGR